MTGLKEQSSDDFRAIIVRADNIPQTDAKIRFYNEIDFPTSAPQDVPIETNPISFRPVRKRARYESELTVEPIVPVVVPVARETSDAIAWAERAYGFTIPSAVLAASLLSKDKKTNPRKLFIQTTLAILAAGMVKGFGDVFAGPVITGNWDDVAADYRTLAQVSSMRSTLVMRDVFRRRKNEEAFANKPVLGISFSFFDGLKSIVHEDPREIQDRLLGDLRFQSTLVESGRRYGTVRTLFQYMTYDPTEGSKQLEIADTPFVDAMAKAIDPLITRSYAPNA